VVVACTNLQILVPKGVEEKRPGQHRNEGNALLVKFIELVDSANRVIRHRFAMSEIDNGRMSQSRIIRLPRQFWHRPGIITGQNHSRHRNMTDQKCANAQQNRQQQRSALKTNLQDN
jgi:hypothetical protein